MTTLDVDCIAISTSTLLPSEAIGMDLYQKDPETDRFVLYRSGDYPLSEEDLFRLRGRGIHQLYIDKTSQTTYQDYLRKLATTDDPDSVPLTARAGAVMEVVRNVLQSVFSRGSLDQTIEAAEDLGTLATDILTKNTFAANDLFRVLHHDYTTFTHSANVAFYCGLLARELGFDRKEIKQITVGGLLHDLGKIDIQEGILCKTERLQDAEFRKIRLHPVLGFRKLANREDMVEGQLMMAYQHHERLDGRGYPLGCVEADIHPWAKLCSVVDVFEALTSQRPYRTPMPRNKALMLQQRESGKAFDPEMLTCWKKIIQNSFVN